MGVIRAGQAADKARSAPGPMWIVPLLALLGCQAASDVLETPLEAAPAATAGVPESSANPVPAAAPQDELPDLGRLSFNAQAAARARSLLDAAPPRPEERALALYTLGAAGERGELARLASAASDGTAPERRAALFAIGLLGDDGLATLLRLRDRDARGVEGPLAFAFLLASRQGSSLARRALEDLAREPGELGDAALLCLQGEDGVLALDEAAPARLHDEMRWRAARRFGLVDGRRWQGVVQERLLSDPAFLDRVVLAAARDLDRGVLRVHLGELLVEAPGPEVLAMAATLFPEELFAAFADGGWQRPTREAAEAMLAAIDEAHAERAARPLLEALLRDRPELAATAGRLVFRAGGELPWPWFVDRIAEGSAAEQKRLVEACGDRRDRALAHDLATFVLEHRDLPIFGEGVIALVRLGNVEAQEVLDRALAAGPSKERTAVLGALGRVLHDGRLARSAQKALAREDLEPELRLALELGRAANGQPGSHATLRTALEAGVGDPVEIVRALAVRPESEDLALLRRMFPTGDSLALDAELALALVRHRDPATAIFLRRALWEPRWNSSLLAGGLLVRVAGAEALLDELDAAPPTTSEGDRRRVGFAIGEWGGLQAVERLARTRGESDPGLQGAVLGALAQRSASRRP